MQTHIIPVLEFRPSSAFADGTLRIIHAAETSTAAIIVCIERRKYIRNILIFRFPKELARRADFPKPDKPDQPTWYFGRISAENTGDGILIRYEEDRKQTFEATVPLEDILRATENNYISRSLQAFGKYHVILAHKKDHLRDIESDEDFLLLECPDGFYLKYVGYPLSRTPNFEAALNRPGGYILTYHVKEGDSIPLIEPVSERISIRRERLDEATA